MTGRRLYRTFSPRY